MKFMIGNSTYQIATATELCGSIEKPDEPVAANYGTISYYSDFERTAEVKMAEECTVNSINQETFLAWYDEQEDQGVCEFMYESGIWRFNWETEVEDMSAIGIDVTLNEGTEYAEIRMNVGWTIDTTSEILEAGVTSASDYNSLGNTSGKEGTFTVDGNNFPFKAVTKFAFGSLATTVPDNFLVYCVNLISLDFSEATGLTTIGNYFLRNCTSFNQSITLPNSIITIGHNFFSSCTSFNQSITLPNSITTIGNSFFYYCTSFNQSITLPNSIITIGNSFFSNCTSFNQSITLPNSITTIGNSFFSNCTSFNQVLTIPSLVTNVGTMFLYGCNNYTSTITIEATACPTDNYSLAVSSSTAAMYTTGVTIAGSGAGAWRFALLDSSSSPYRKIIYNHTPTPTIQKSLKFTSTGAQTLGIKTSALGTITPNLYYSVDNGTTWNTWNVSTTISFGNGTDLYLCGYNYQPLSSGGYYTNFVFSTSSPVDCTGNIMHLFNCESDLTTLTGKGTYRMFESCRVLTTAPALPATTLTKSCYVSMFYNCSSLTIAPALPATTLTEGCYEMMFYGCTSLTTAPSLPATTLAKACYQMMFMNCSALVTAPSLPATTMVQSCYSAMFQGCTRLTAIPALPAATLVTSCYQGMFSYCSNVKISETQTGEYQNAYIFGAVPSSTYAKNMFTGTGGTFTGTPTAQVYYTSNTIVS